ncbi:MAG: SDR family oxidoreductase [Gemmataceae bacterium]
MAELCVVTGGAGFIGSHLVDALTAAGKRVRVLDDLSTGHPENLAGSNPELVRGSVTDPATVKAAVAGADTVYHLAAMASVAKSLEDPLRCHAICATGTLEVLNAARQAGVRRVVYAASSSAYGPAADPDGLDEDTPLRPLSPYASAKLAGEHYLEAFAASYGLETVRLRFFNIFGPRQRADSPYSGVIALFTAALTEGRTPTVHGDGQQCRDFVYVTDAVQSLMKGAATPGVSGRVYNVGTGRKVSVLDLIAALNRVLGTNVTPTHGPARAGDVRFSLAKIGRIRSELGYEPQVPFEDGLRQTIAWYKAGA